MGSLNAQKVALKVSEKVMSNELVNIGEIIRDSGYSNSVSLKPSKVTNTLSFKKTMEYSLIPLIEGIQAQISKVKEEIANKDLSQEEYRVLVGSLDILIKNHQVLQSTVPTQVIISLTDEQKKNLDNLL